MVMLDPNTVQILFADLQPQIVARSKTNKPDAMARSAAVLTRVARLLQLPMHLSVVPEGRHRPELIPELARETRSPLGTRSMCRWMRVAACRPVRRTRRSDRSRQPAGSRRPSSRWSRR
jgi:hypothetical protein